MKGDFSRIRFNSAKLYTAVLKQQGRVDLDSDANEQRAIDVTLRETTNADVIGPYGGPENGAGFAIGIENEKIWISAGRYYVDGILIEISQRVNYDHQPYLVDPGTTAKDLLQQLLEAGEGSTLQFVLEVWQRMATALDDPCLLEPALGQADTTTRLQTVWRVVGAIVSSQQQSGGSSAPQQMEAQDIVIVRGPTIESGNMENNPITQLSPCCQALYNGLSSLPHTGEMGAGLAQSGSGCGCEPIPAAGYRGLENQLYRVEIHTAGDLSSATFKWSRENGSVVAQVTQAGASSATIGVASLGPDANLGFQAGEWVELSDDTNQFGPTPNQPGILYQIYSVNQSALQVTMTTPVVGLDTTKNARMRRWDQSGASATSSGIPVSSTPIPLENGIEVDFRKGQFQSGDYWLIPARTASGQIDWPPCGGNGKHFQRSSYMQIDQAPLACVGLPSYNQYFNQDEGGAANEGRFQVSDCRLLFPPLTAIAASAAQAALHVSAISWSNDDVMTADALVGNGLTVTFDQATTCPWGGGNFQVSMELPNVLGIELDQLAGNLPGVPKPTLSAPAGTNCFLRTVLALDPPYGILVDGDKVNWIAPVPVFEVNYGAIEVLALLNTLLKWKNPTGYARVRVRLIGGAVYGSGANGNIYLDGQSFGDTGSRAMDSSECVNYNLPSGNSEAVSDYEGWFYLAPTAVIISVVIEAVENGQETTVSAIKVLVNSNNQVTGFQIGETASATKLQALITLSYPPVAPTTVTLGFSPSTASSVVGIAPSIVIPAGQATATTPINVLSNPGGGVTDTVTLNASISTPVMVFSVDSPPTLSIAGMTPP
ncbi:MAG: DUF6519 domain-containing protein [Terracidiphilus sp.]